MLRQKANKSNRLRCPLRRGLRSQFRPAIAAGIRLWSKSSFDAGFTSDSPPTTSFSHASIEPQTEIAKATAARGPQKTRWQAFAVGEGPEQGRLDHGI